MNKMKSLSLALIMLTASLVGCLGGDSEIPDEDWDGVEDGLDLCPQTPGQGVESAKDLVDEYGCSQFQYDQGDRDGDDVMGQDDLCPDTPAGEAVNTDGCAQSQLDDDEDGVMNDVDLCPDTLHISGAPTTANADGCDQSQLDELNDDDGDGVLNDVDLCPNSPPITGGNWHVADGCLATQVDDDGDGVMNRRIRENDPGSTSILDLCPNTLAGETVDADGCSQSQFDDDDDGVMNNLDICVLTPAGETVDADGCSQTQLDDDNDGVMNNLDICVLTPAGETVDADGCSQSQLDDDGDGVMNNLDLCALTPTGETVDAGGCSQSQYDDDGDGAMNDVDQCPRTSSGSNVDATGCGSYNDLKYATNIWGYHTLNDEVYFFSVDSTNGMALWKDDSTSGLTLVKVINSAATYDNGKAGMIKVSDGSTALQEDTLYFFAADGTHGTELWKTDGTESGTVMVKDINPNGSSRYQSNKEINPVAIDGIVYFWADDGTHGYELWTSDGTETGTVMVKDIYNGSGSSFGVYELVVFGNNLYFSAQNATSNYWQLWKSDGTESGTAMLKAINPSGSSGGIKNLIAVGNTLYFSANDGTNGEELWTSDGTTAGTMMVKDINSGSAWGAPASGLSYASELTAFGDVYFIATDGTHGEELWKSDGTETGTVMVKDINSGSNSSSPSQLIVVDNVLYFKADDGINGCQLWKSDGTETGTVMVNSNSSHNCGSTYLNFGTSLYFRAAQPTTSNISGWVSDGTPEGANIIDGFYGSDSVVATSWWLFGHGTSLYIQVNLASGQVLLVKISI